MESMITRIQLLENIKNMLAVEVKAWEEYDADTHSFKNFVIIKRISSVRDDEVRHIAMLRELVAMLEKPYQK